MLCDTSAAISSSSQNACHMMVSEEIAILQDSLPNSRNDDVGRGTTLSRGPNPSISGPVIHPAPSNLDEILVLCD